MTEYYVNVQVKEEKEKEKEEEKVKEIYEWKRVEGVVGNAKIM